MQSTDLADSWKSANSQVESIKTYNDISSASKELKSSIGDSLSKSVGDLASQLGSISDQQKRYLRGAPTSMDQLLNLFGTTNGQGPESLKYLRKKLLEASVKMEPQIQKILSEETLKVLGCSQEQSYVGIPKASLELQPLPLQPVSQGIYIPVQSLDIANMLKSPVDSKIGNIFYEKQEPSTDTKFKPFGGDEPYPMNKTLNLRLNELGTSFYTQFGKNYQGKSQQDLFDIQYTTTNEFGVSGNFYRVILIDRESSVSAGVAANKVGEFLKDYYSTIKLVDSVDWTAQLMNILSGAINMKAQLGSNDLLNQSKFYLLLQRILGLCFDSRREIDVSGISKVAELDGVDESFFEFTEIDLRNIDLRTTNIQNGVVEFEDCGNVKLPVDYNTIIDELVIFRDSLSGQTPEQQVTSIEKIIDTLSQNPSWDIPKNVNISLSINKNILKQIPLAIASSVLSPKVLLPIFAMLSVVESSAKNTYNQALNPINALIQSGNTVGSKVNNIVGNNVDFVRVFKQFNTDVVSRIGALYLKTLFEILKKDIINLLSVVIKDIQKSSAAKKYAIILRLIGIALVVAQLINDYRKCKSLVEDILALLKLINGGVAGGFTIPLPLLALTKFLPGFSAERATINTLQELQSLGVPTGPMPDGSPNFMNIFIKSIHSGADKEQSENGKVEAFGLVPPLTGGYVEIFGKSV